MWQERVDMNEDVLIFAIKTTLNNRLSTRSFIYHLLYDDRKINIAMEKLNRDISASESSRRAIFK